MRGSHSARVVRSSSAEVHMEFVLHILEEEAEDWKDEEDDGREDRQQEKEWRVAENTQHECMKMTHAMM